MTNYYAGIEAGGTKFICAVANEEGRSIERTVLRTTQPEETLSQVVSFLKRINKTYPLSAIGIGSFGPIDAELGSPTFGYIQHTPKTAWINCNIVGYLNKRFDLPIGFETDVNVAALGEYEYGAAKNSKNFIYMTVGTGIGAAAMLDGKILKGMTFSEMGHMLIPHNTILDPYTGNCPYHGDCFEGLACGEAIKERWQVLSALDLPSDHNAWELEADYIAAGLMNLILVLSPELIIVGGGVMRQQHLFPKIRAKVLKKINTYVSTELLNHIDTYIVPPGLADNAGVHGAIALAKKIHLTETKRMKDA